MIYLCLFFQYDYARVEQSIDRAISTTVISPDVLNATSTSLLDVKKTAVVAATAALITAQALQNQYNPPPPSMPSNGTVTETNNAASSTPTPWANLPVQPAASLPP